MPAGIGPTELIIVLVIALIILGPKKLPGAGRSLGQGLREFKDSVSGGARDDDDARRTLTPASDAPARRDASPAPRA
jgi:sec-independent protein translocase protein TatA